MKPVSPQNLPPDAHDDAPGAWLSALIDGEATAADRACGLWRDDEKSRRDWHAYHLIGDVLRSEELARPAKGDAAFLAGVRARLAAEPVVLAPEPVPVPAPVRRRQPWLMPAAAAAGFAVVAGVLVVSRLGQPDALPGSADNTLALGQPAVRVAPQVASTTPVMMIRDPLLDEYLRAHRSIGASIAVAAPGGTLRRVELSIPASGPAR